MVRVRVVAEGECGVCVENGEPEGDLFRFELAAMAAVVDVDEALEAAAFIMDKAVETDKLEAETEEAEDDEDDEDDDDEDEDDDDDEDDEDDDDDDEEDDVNDDESDPADVDP